MTEGLVHGIDLHTTRLIEGRWCLHVHHPRHEAGLMSFQEFCWKRFSTIRNTEEAMISILSYWIIAELYHLNLHKFASWYSFSDWQVASGCGIFMSHENFSVEWSKFHRQTKEFFISFLLILPFVSASTRSKSFWKKKWFQSNNIDSNFANFVEIQKSASSLPFHAHFAILVCVNTLKKFQERTKFRTLTEQHRLDYNS